MKPSIDQQIRFVLEMFRENSTGSLFSSKELNINKLEMIGKMRFILSQSAIWMYEFEIRIKLDSTGNQSDVQRSGEFPRLLERLHKYTAECSSKWPR